MIIDAEMLVENLQQRDLDFDVWFDAPTQCIVVRRGAISCEISKRVIEEYFRGRMLYDGFGDDIMDFVINKANAM